jgi:hypothetical protein
MVASPYRAVMLTALLAGLSLGVHAAPPLANLKVPPGFHVSIFSDQVPNARAMALGTRNTVFVGSMHDAIFIAEHGSWNRSRKSGYRVTVLHVGKDGKVTGSKPFLTGFLDGQESLGRPADVQPLRDGSLLVSDDDNGVIYRITYNGK